MNMREINLIIEDWVSPIFVSNKKVGRPLNTKKKVLVQKPEVLSADFYLTISKLSDSEIDAFIQTYQLTEPFGKHNGLATKADIKDFQIELKRIAEYLGKLKNIPSSQALTLHAINQKTSSTTNKETWSLMPSVNQHLSNCNLEFVVAPAIREALSTKETGSFSRELAEMDDGLSATTFLRNDVLNNFSNGKRGRGTNLWMLKIRAHHILSWCVLCLVVDELFRKRNVGICLNCNTLFFPERRNQPYCKIASCQTSRVSERKRKSRTKKS
jgi:hypothetical protein